MCTVCRTPRDKLLDLRGAVCRWTSAYRWNNSAADESAILIGPAGEHLSFKGVGGDTQEQEEPMETSAGTDVVENAETEGKGCVVM